jgi:hypothetical protein
MVSVTGCLRGNTNFKRGWIVRAKEFVKLAALGFGGYKT